RMEQEFRKKLSLPELFQAPTVEQMAALVRGDTLVSLCSRVLPLQPRGSRPPLFWIGAGPFIRPLSQRLDDDQPFLGLMFTPSDVEEFSTPYSVRKIARFFVEAAR